jgi:hypothetical protein
LIKRLERVPTGDPGLAHWSRANVETRRRWLTDLRKTTHAIQPGLDYSKEITSTARHGFGDTLLLRAGTRAIGMSTLWLTSPQEDPDHKKASIQIMTIDPACTTEDSFQALIQSTETLAHLHNRPDITVPVNTRHTWAVDQLLDAGYRVERLSVRMILDGTNTTPPTDEYVNLSRWAG